MALPVSILVKPSSLGVNYMISSWEQSKKRSNYHFDNFKNDSQVDKVIKIGKILADYTEDVKHAVETAKPENWEITPNLKKISDLFGLDDCTECIHVQMPGEVCNLHLEKLEKWSPSEPWRVMCIQVALTDWEQGHFCSYGNYNHQQWRAGDVTTFDWQNIPNCTANAGHNPRVTYQLTGIITEKTNDFLKRLTRFEKHELNERSNDW